jgi:hypothetical protein
VTSDGISYMWGREAAGDLDYLMAGTTLSQMVANDPDREVLERWILHIMQDVWRG